MREGIAGFFVFRNPAGRSRAAPTPAKGRRAGSDRPRCRPGSGHAAGCAGSGRSEDRTAGDLDGRGIACVTTHRPVAAWGLNAPRLVRARAGRRRCREPVIGYDPPMMSGRPRGPGDSRRRFAQFGAVRAVTSDLPRAVRPAGQTGDVSRRVLTPVRLLTSNIGRTPVTRPARRFRPIVFLLGCSHGGIPVIPARMGWRGGIARRPA